MALFVIGPKSALAAESAKVSVTSATVEKGKEVSVTVTVSATSEIEMFQFYLYYDTTKLQFISGVADSSEGSPITVINYSPSGKSQSYTYKFKAIDLAESGTALTLKNVIVCPHDVSVGTSFPTTISNGKVTINPPYQASNNANLASLSIGEAKISPAFSANVTAYTASVAGTVSKVTVSAKAEHAKAKVAVTGNSGLKEGANTVNVKVTAEDGKTTKTYTITVTRGKAPTPKPATATPTPTPAAKIKVGDTDMDLKGKPDTKWTEDTEEWETTVVEYKKQKIGALTSKINGVTVVELSDGNLYLLDTEKGTATRYFSFDSVKQNIILLDVSDEVTIPMGYSKTTKEIEGAQVPAYVSSETSEYALVYGRNDKGFTGWFQYDLSGGTFQRFNTENVELNPTPIPTPTPIPSPTPSPMPTPTPEILPTVPADVPVDKASASTSGTPFMQKVFMGTSAGLFLLTLIFMILYLVQKARYNRRFAPDEDYSDDEDYL